jgi:hypothetical protein
MKVAVIVAGVVLVLFLVAILAMPMLAVLQVAYRGSDDLYRYGD